MFTDNSIIYKKFPIQTRVKRKRQLYKRRF
jgi:hypothetical protein